MSHHHTHAQPILDNHISIPLGLCGVQPTSAVGAPAYQVMTYGLYQLMTYVLYQLMTYGLYQLMTYVLYSHMY